MINKKLLNVILGDTFISVRLIGKEVQYKNEVDEICGIWRVINLYELMNLCKVWALENGGRIDSRIYYEGLSRKKNKILKASSTLHYGCQKLEFYVDTEPEAVFKACEWILKVKDRK